MNPLCIDLFCGLGGWADGFLAEGYEVVGFDNHHHVYGEHKYPAQLVLQDVLHLSGKQFRNAAVIVASPPCQEYSWMAMPWSLAKQKAAWYREDVTRQLELNCLFNACFRIAHEAGVPLVVENVKGAQPWVGQARAHYGSFYLWGDIASVGGAVAAMRPKFGELVRPASRKLKGGDRNKNRADGHAWTHSFADQLEADAGTKNDGGSLFAIANNTTSGHGQNPDGRKVQMNFHEHEKTGKPGRSFQSAAVDGLKVPAESGRRTDVGKGARFTSRDCGIEALHADRDAEGTKQHGSGPEWWRTGNGAMSSKSSARKAASAQIAKIPFPLASYVARIFKP